MVTFDWFYPPPYFFWVWPFGYLSPAYAYACFMMATGALYLSALLRTLPGMPTLAAALGFSGLWLNLMMGQNGFLSAGLLGWALYYLQRRPFVAGMLLGLLTFKPHLGLLIPLALGLGRQWRCIMAAGLTFLVLLMTSVLAFGWEAWEAWIRNFPLVRLNLSNPGPVFLAKVSSVYAFVRIQGGTEKLAYACQALVAMLVVAMLVWVWRSKLSQERKLTVLVLSALLVTPYVLEYDLTWLAVAGVWWVKSWGGVKPARSEYGLLLLLWLLPELMYAFSLWNLRVVLAQPVLLAALGWLWWSSLKGRSARHG